MLLDFKSIKHDQYGAIEQPVLTLKTPHGSVISTIAAAKDIQLTLRYNDVSELNFEIPAFIEDEEVPHYSEVLGLRVIEVENFGDFILINPEIKNEGGKKEVKTCTAYSAEYALNFKRVELAGDTYNFCNPVDNSNTIIGIILETIPDWSIGHVDSELIGRWRTFEQVDESVYDFIMNTLQEAYNCLFIFNNKKKTIDVISATRTPENLPIWLSYDNLLKTATIKELSDEVVTALSGYGSGDEVSIRDVNPNGSTKIYNIDYFINRGDLPDDLAAKWGEYSNALELYQDIYSNFRAAFNEKDSAVTIAKAKYTALKTDYDATNTTYLTQLEAEKAVTDEEARVIIQTQIGELKAKLEELTNKMSDANDEMVEAQRALDDSQKELKEIVSACKLETFFTKDELKILKQYFIESSVTEDTFVVSEYGAATSDNICLNLTEDNNASVSIDGSALYATNLAQVIPWDSVKGQYVISGSVVEVEEVDGSTTEYDDGSGSETTSYIGELADLLGADTQQSIIDQLNNSLKQRFYEFRGGKLNLKYTNNDKDVSIRGNIVNVNLNYNVENLDSYNPENPSDLSTKQHFTLTAELREAYCEDSYYPSMCLAVSGYMRDPQPQNGDNFLSFKIKTATYNTTGAVSEYKRQNILKELYDYTQSELKKLSSPSYEFDVDSGNFIFAQEFEPFKDALQLGNTVNLKLDVENEDGDGFLQPILIELKLNFANGADFDLKFSDKYRSSDSEFKLADLITEATRTSHSVSLNKASYSAFKDSEAGTQVQDMKTSALDIGKNKIINASNQSMEWNSSGMFLRKRTEDGYDDKQVGLINDTIAFTRDDWNSIEIAIGAINDENTGLGYGIVAPSIYGTLLAGENLVIENKVFNEDGTTINKQFRVDSTGAWLNNSSLVLQNDSTQDSIAHQMFLDPRYGFAAGSNIYNLNGTEIKPTFIDEDGNIIMNENETITLYDDEGNPLGQSCYVPKNAQFYFDINTGNAYFAGTINAKNIMAGTLNGMALKQGTLSGSALASGTTIDGSVVNLTNVDAENLIGTVNANKVAIENLTAENFEGKQIIADLVDASKITGDLIEAINASIGKIDTDKLGAIEISAEQIESIKARIGMIDTDTLIIDEENAKVIICGDYGIAVGDGDLFTVTQDEEGKNVVTPHFLNEDGELNINEETGMPEHSTFFFDIKTGKLYLSGADLKNINASNITAGTIDTKFLNADDIVAKGTITADKLSSNVIEAINLSASGTISTDKLNANDIVATGEITAKKLSGTVIEAINLSTSEATIGAAHIGDLDASKIITGTLGADVIYSGEIGATQITAGTLGADVIYGGTIGADKITSGELSSDVIYTGSLTAEQIASNVVSAINLSTETATINGAHIGDLDASKITTGTLGADVVYSGYVDADKIKAGTLSSDVIYSGYIDADKISAGTLGVDVVYAGDIDAKQITAGTLGADVVYTGALTADQIKSGQIDTKYLNTTQLDAQYANLTFANIDAANIDVAKMGTLFSTVGLIDRATISEGHITGYLDAVEINANKITAGNLKADRLELKGEDGLYYAINATVDGVTAEQLATEEYQTLIHGDKIIANSITATQIDVTDLFAQDITASGNIINAGDFSLGSTGALVYDSDTDTLTIRAGSISIGTTGNSSNVATKDDLEEAIPLQLEIISSNGTIFKNNNIQTILTVRVWKGQEDVTDEYTDSQFSWTRISKDTEGDEIWNNGHSHTKTVAITKDEVYARAVFNVNLNI